MKSLIQRLWKDPGARRNELIAREKRDKEAKLQLAVRRTTKINSYITNFTLS
jgi:hypothetical protein